jgi:hypothetical protein
MEVCLGAGSAVPASETERQLSVRLGDLRRDARQWARRAESGHSSAPGLEPPLRSRPWRLFPYLAGASIAVFASEASGPRTRSHCWSWAQERMYYNSAYWEVLHGIFSS